MISPVNIRIHKKRQNHCTFSFLIPPEIFAGQADITKKLSNLVNSDRIVLFYRHTVPSLARLLAVSVTEVYLCPHFLGKSAQEADSRLFFVTAVSGRGTRGTYCRTISSANRPAQLVKYSKAAAVFEKILNNPIYSSENALRGCWKNVPGTGAGVARKPGSSGTAVWKCMKKHTICAMTPLAHNPLKCRLIG